VLRRLIISATLLLFLVLVLAALWAGFDWPPPRLILRYGFPPAGGPTGRTMAIEGVEFVEPKPGYSRKGSHFLCQKGSLLGRAGGLPQQPWGKPRHDHECQPRGFLLEYRCRNARLEVPHDRPNVPDTRARHPRTSRRH
jgi:hypothetical protein